MYSGGDSSGDLNKIYSQYPLATTQVGLTALAGGAGQIDWASLAQQWIQMRDNNAAMDMQNNVFDNNAAMMPAAPPPPNISGNYVGSTQAIDEKGEADMDMEDEDDFGSGGNNITFRSTGQNDLTPPPPPNMQLNNTSNVMQSQWYMQAQHDPALQAQWNVWPPRVNLPPPNMTPTNSSNPTAHIPSLLKLNVANPHSSKQLQVLNADATNEGTLTMDAAKRKMLPAWIREGLEKMEREKLKQMEKEQQFKSKNYDDDASATIQRTQHSDEINNIVNKDQDFMVKNKNLTRYVESDEDSSGNEDEEDINGTAILTTDEATTRSIANRNTQSAHSPTETNAATDKQHNLSPVPEDFAEFTGKSYEQKLADLMFVVRRTLTELLLEVTNEEISNIAQETMKTHKFKAELTSSAQVIHKSALSSITGKLGLSAYADSSSDESDASDADTTDHEDDSEEELKASIRSKGRAFAKISEEIEERIEASAAQEEQKLKYYTQLEQKQRNTQRQRDIEDEDETQAQDSNDSGDRHFDASSGKNRQASTSTGASGKGFENDFGETTDSNLQQSNGNRRRERAIRKERTTRFSDNKDSKGGTASNYMSQLSNSNHAGTSSSILHTNQPVPLQLVDVNGLYTMATTLDKKSSNGSASGSSSSSKQKKVSVPDAEKNKNKRQSSTERERERRRRRDKSHDKDNSSSSSSSSSDSDDSSSSTDSSSNSSKGSKYSRTSSSRNNPRDYRGSSSRSVGDRRASSSRSISSSKRHSDYYSKSSSRSNQNRSSSSSQRYSSNTTYRRSDDYDSYDRSHRSSSSRHASRRSRSRSKTRSSHSSSSRHRR